MAKLVKYMNLFSFLQLISNGSFLGVGLDISHNLSPFPNLF